MNAETFNSFYPVGTLVFAYPGARPEDIPSARRLVTRTRTVAQSVGLDRDGVVWVDDEGAYISLTHVDVVPEAEWEAAKLADAEAAEGDLSMPVGTDLRSVVHAALRTVQDTTHHLGLITLELLADRVTDALTRANVTLPNTPAAADAIEYGIRIPDGTVLKDGTLTDRREQESRLDRYRDCWPEAVLVQRPVRHGEWAEVAS
ncbi:hypothetical protein OG601_46920 [Streptomyces sp. NBC_01239]|uniref:hypothetical protein n=1 Tax=Streptomyces sp. NBC_01239 TaxID=2903792 RepID=UPI00224D5637|nr:hypothetical protein [Streptomyces sp. NBC_01239]MCX4809076.1 hypothetical protein [Streptomyces sp. NBC_01239]MCX4818107.1 hypothetical protein [Streptomyces sp. NBC_01239]